LLCEKNDAQLMGSHSVVAVVVIDELHYVQHIQALLGQREALSAEQPQQRDQDAAQPPSTGSSSHKQQLP
jgi:hypothetical protein